MGTTFEDLAGDSWNGIADADFAWFFSGLNGGADPRGV
jgi:hypothetical protein